MNNCVVKIYMTEENEKLIEEIILFFESKGYFFRLRGKMLYITRLKFDKG